MDYKSTGDRGMEVRPSTSSAAAVPLARSWSIYSLTFDELQTTVGGFGKDFGSMNMDEFLKNVWTAEESQATAAPPAAASHGGDFGPGLQRQGSLTLPRTLSQKTVDEVWRGLDEFQHQPTLGEMTLEEFLVRAGVVREDVTQSESLINNNNNISINNNNNISSRLFFSEPTASNNNNSSSLFFSEPTANNTGIGTVGLSSVIPYPAPLQLGGSVDLMSPQGMRGGGVMRIGDPTVNNESMTGMLSVSTAVLPTNPISSDGYMKGNRELSPLSPIPYVFNEGIKVRKCGGAVEKVVERRQRRMIKNRESAARSRARKQAYTMELEAEIAKLKDQNEDLQIKQVESMKMQKDQILEIIDQHQGPKKRCLRRTKTGPW